MIPQLETIPLIHLASGDRLFLQVYKFIGAQPGKKVYIQSNLHGSELTGNAVIHQLIEFLSAMDEVQLTGQIWLVPMCNPVGVNARAHHYASGRYNLYDGRDWNRIFWDFEQTQSDILGFAEAHLTSGIETVQAAFQQEIQAAFTQLNTELHAPSGVPFWEKYRYVLQSLCLDADYVIDLHTSSDRGIEYVYFFRDREHSVPLFLLEYGILLTGYDGDAFDEAFMKPWLALEAAFSTLGRSLKFDIEAYTLELGSSMEFNPASIAKGVRGVLHYLAVKKFLAIPDMPQNTSTEMRLLQRDQVQRYFAPTGGMVQNQVKLGDVVQPQQLLYQLLSFNKQGNAPIVLDVLAECEGLVFDVAINPSVNEGEYVLGIFRS